MNFVLKVDIAGKPPMLLRRNAIASRRCDGRRLRRRPRSAPLRREGRDRDLRRGPTLRGSDAQKFGYKLELTAREDASGKVWLEESEPPRATSRCGPAGAPIATRNPKADSDSDAATRGRQASLEKDAEGGARGPRDRCVSPDGSSAPPREGGRSDEAARGGERQGARAEGAGPLVVYVLPSYGGYASPFVSKTGRSRSGIRPAGTSCSRGRSSCRGGRDRGAAAAASFDGPEQPRAVGSVMRSSGTALYT
jgi:hypothetical protein